MKQRILILAGLFALVSLWGSAVPVDAQTLWASARAESISPFDFNHCWMGGFNTGLRAQGIHDDIKARIFMMRDDDTELCLAVVDLMGFMNDRTDQVRNAIAANEGLPKKNIIVCSTHTHEACDAVGFWGERDGKSGVYPPFNEYVAQQIIAGVHEARQNYRPVRVRFGTGQDIEFQRDTRDPQVMDPNVTTMQAVDYDGNVVASLTCYGNHPEVLWSANTQITADYPYYITKTLEDTFGGTSVFVSGSLGGLITPTSREHTFTESERIGGALGQIAVNSLLGAQLYDYLDINTSAETVLIPVTNPLLLGAVKGGLLEFDWQQLVDMNYSIPTDIHFWNFGNVMSTCSIPGELFPEAGFDIYSFMPGQHKMLFNLANSELGYLIPYSQWKWPENPFEPGDNYEETFNVSREAVPLIVDSLYRQMGAPSPTPGLTDTPTVTPTSPPTNTPRPTRTPTNTPTTAPTGTPTETPVTGPPPFVMLAGYWGSTITAQEGGTFSFLAIAQAASGGTLAGVRFEGVDLPPIDAANGVYGYMGVPLSGPIPPMQFSASVVAYDDQGQEGYPWPWLTVYP